MCYKFDFKGSFNLNSLKGGGVPVSVCHGSCGKEVLLSSYSPPPNSLNPTPGFYGQAIRTVAVIWIVKGPRLLQPLVKGERPPHRGGSPQPWCPYPPRMHIFHPPRIHRGRPPTSWRCCTSTALPLVSGMYKKVHKTINSKTKSS